MRYKYELIRSDRRSVCVQISADNKITVRCPWTMRPEKIEEFLDKKAIWIENVVLKNSKKLSLNDDVIEMRKIYYFGKILPLIVSDKNKIGEDAVYVKNLNSIQKLYTEHCSDEFSKRVQKFSDIARLYPKTVSFKNYSSRWGCCDASKNLTFNFKLFMLPEEIQNYVIVHELCHTLCFNHSQAFWKLVSEFIPDYKEMRKQLSYYDFLISLY